ncbi:hypothetical protein CAPTEDRAFT_211257 [Capitella teleta]|uniref:Sulfotransferase domain-containing protein n=1 Tax=Capitella teleta TaxID=283909 RepID=R7TIA3_CAPTE|nr:hypothetical protein CAPTEDRAFT_211257 [Capitella teleta]|eukprot:ELT93568.1 hypothetical protein CAPTEDRAFT_211257 [Capitella teleta]
MSKLSSTIAFFVWLLFCLIVRVWNKVLSWKYASQLASSKVKVQQVLVKYNLDALILDNSISYFLLGPPKFQDIDIINKQNVCLYYVNDDEAFFVETPPELQIWKSSVSPFYKITQNSQACNIIRMPLHRFLEFTDTLTDPGDRLSFIIAHGRSGSTILLQVMEKTREVISYSEPEDLEQPFHDFKAKLDPQQKVRIARANAKYACRCSLDGNMNETRFVMKVMWIKIADSFGHFELFRKAFPSANLLLLYRDRLQTLSSSLATFQHMPLMETCSALIGETTYMRKKMIVMRNGGILDTMYEAHPELQDLIMRTDDPLAVLFYSISAAVWGRFRCGNFKKDLPAVKYEDLMNNKVGNLAIVFKHLRLPLSSLSAGMGAFTTDSHQNTWFSKRKVSSKYTSLLSPNSGSRSLVKSLNEVNAIFGLPPLGNGLRISNTISTPVRLS